MQCSKIYIFVRLLSFIIVPILFSTLFFSTLFGKNTNSLNVKSENRVIYIYSGPGTDEVAISQAESMLRALTSPGYKIKKIGPREVKEGKWLENAVLFIMPGGADLPYVEHLSPQGNLKIKEFVRTGGAYLGFCAGAYYGAQEIEFSLNTPLEVTGKRELAFYQGLAQGPVLAPYDYQSKAGARVASLRWVGGNEFLYPKTLFFSYFNGGCHFVNAEKVKNATVLAKYIEENGTETKAAIVEISVEKSKVILSGVHIEYSPNFMNDKDIYLKPIIKRLKEVNEERIQLMKHLLKRLGIKII